MKIKKTTYPNRYSSSISVNKTAIYDEILLIGDILTKVDVAAMMHGLECRTPLTDVRIAEMTVDMYSAHLDGRKIDRR